MIDIAHTEKGSQRTAIYMVLFVVLAGIYAAYAYSIQLRTYSGKVYFDAMQDVSHQLKNSAESPSLRERQNLLLSLHRLRAGGGIQTENGDKVMVSPIQDYLEGDKSSLNKVLNAVSNSDISRANSIMQGITNKFQDVQNGMVSKMLRLPFLMVLGVVLFCLLLRHHMQRANQQHLNDNESVIKQACEQVMPVSEDIFTLDRNLQVAFHKMSSLHSEICKGAKFNASFIDLLGQCASESFASEVQLYLRSLFDSRNKLDPDNSTGPLRLIRITSTDKLGRPKEKFYRIDLAWQQKEGIKFNLKGVVKDISAQVQTENELKLVKLNFINQKSFLKSVLLHGEEQIRTFLKRSINELKGIRASASVSSKWANTQLPPVPRNLFTKLIVAQHQEAKKYELKNFLSSLTTLDAYAVKLVSSKVVDPGLQDSFLRHLSQVITQYEELYRLVSTDAHRKVSKTKPETVSDKRALSSFKNAIIETVQLCQREFDCNIVLRLQGLESANIPHAKIKDFNVASYVLIKQRLASHVQSGGTVQGSDTPAPYNLSLVFSELGDSYELMIKDDADGFCIDMIKSRLVTLGLVKPGRVGLLSTQELAVCMFSSKYSHISKQGYSNGLFLAASSVFKASGKVVGDFSGQRLSGVSLSLPKSP